MRFKIDEQLPVEIARTFRSSGYDAHTVEEERMSGAPDPEIALVCQNEKRTLVTLDLGFGDIRAYSPSEFYGIIVLRPPTQDKRTVLMIIERLISVLRESSPEGLLWIVDEQRIRVRE